MVVDPQRADLPSGGEPASEPSGAAWLDSELADLARQAEAEASQAGMPADDGGDVPSPPSGERRAADGEPASALGTDADVPSPPVADSTDPAISALERRQGESRAAWVKRVQEWGSSLVEENKAATERAREAEQKQLSSMSEMQQRYEKFREWVGPEPNTPEYQQLQQQAMDGDWDARAKFDQYSDRRQFQQVIRLVNFAEMANDLEQLAESEGITRDDFRARHGGTIGGAMGVIAAAAVGKVTAEKDAQIAKLQNELKDERTAHQSTKDRAAAGGLQLVNGGRPGGGGPLGQFTDMRGIPTAEAIDAAMEGRLTGLDLTMGEG